jgi:uncharacterized protein YdbL (DUF1318 family)
MTPTRLLAPALLLAGCAQLPTVPVKVAPVQVEPMKLDVNVTMEIINKTPPAPKTDPVADGRRARMAELQKLKDNRLVGEASDARLSVRDLPPTWTSHDSYVRALVAAENRDRDLHYAAEAARTGKSEPDIRNESARQFRDRAFPGEWIQDPDSGQWKQK